MGQGHSDCIGRTRQSQSRGLLSGAWLRGVGDLLPKGLRRHQHGELIRVEDFLTVGANSLPASCAEGALVVRPLPLRWNRVCDLSLGNQFLRPSRADRHFDYRKTSAKPQNDTIGDQIIEIGFAHEVNMEAR